MENSADFKKDCLDVIRAVLIAVVVALLLVLVMALIVRWASLDSTTVTPIMYVIKILSMLVGILFGFKCLQNGIIKGAAAGMLFMLFSYLIFASLSAFKETSFSWIDMLCLTLGGGVCGVITVNLKEKLHK